MSEETADKIIDAVLKVFETSDLPVMDSMTLFAKIQNIIYAEVDENCLERKQ